MKKVTEPIIIADSRINDVRVSFCK